MDVTETDHGEQVLIVGLGVVGRAIAADHVRHGVSVWVADQDPSVVHRVGRELADRFTCDVRMATAASPMADGFRCPLARSLLNPRSGYRETGRDSPGRKSGWLVIESIAERLDLKQAFFRDAESWFEGDVVFGSNTSTLSVLRIGDQMQRPERLCGLHFFMPVVGRPACEWIASERTGRRTLETCVRHARRTHKTLIPVADRPGFVVNRMLTPYLNEAFWLLCGGISERDIRRAALRFGMPMSPLELVDHIGARTAFDGGRVVWQAFPKRIVPSPLLPALVKRGFLGRQWRQGIYDYDSLGRRSGAGLAAGVGDLVNRYRHDEVQKDLQVARGAGFDLIYWVAGRLANAIVGEAELIVEEGVASQSDVFVLATRGLGFFPSDQPAAFWDSRQRFRQPLSNSNTAS